MKRKQLQQGKGALDLIEESVHLLRLAPATVLFTYYLGTLPFLLGLLYFWSDMSRSSFAAQRLPAAALGVALLFFWMKGWQALFARQLLARLGGEPSPSCAWRDLARTALWQGIFQPSGLFILPVMAVLLAPFGWVYAFYQNLTVLGCGEAESPGQLARTAWRQALLWPGQNNHALIVFKLFGLFVFVNLMTGFLVIPFLLKTVLGVETVFSRSMAAVFNPTFFAALAALTHLCMDPLVKAFYVLRCFYGESLRTGLDLKTELRSFVAGKLAAAGVLALMLGGLVPASAASAAPIPEAETPLTGRQFRAAVSPEALDRAIREVIDRREYNWRLPRQKVTDGAKEKGTLATLVDGMLDTLRDWARQAGRWVRKLFKWLFGDREWSRPDGLDLGRMSGLRWLLALLIMVLACVIGIMILRAWRQRRAREEIVAQAIQAVPDVADENVGADQLPEDGWLKLGRELIERGELRLALRAFYLSSLAHLAERHFISLEKFKSNLDYQRELGRRSHALPELTTRFSENVSVFDRVWYGLHEVTRETLARFEQNVERIKTQT